MAPQRISSCFHPIDAAPHIDTLVHTYTRAKCPGAMKITATFGERGVYRQTLPLPRMYITGEGLGNRHPKSTLDAIGPDNSYSFISYIQGNGDKTDSMWQPRTNAKPTFNTPTRELAVSEFRK